MVSPIAKSAHIGLINSCQDFLPHTQKMILLTKAMLPTINDEIKAIQLRNCTNQLASAVADLKACLAQMHDVCGSFDVDAMIESIKSLDKELIDLRNAAASTGMLKPLPGETVS